MSEIVREGYRRNDFDEWRTRIIGDPRDDWADLLVSNLLPGARVLELGCGLGEPKLAAFDVTGVDLVARAEGVLEADFLELELPDASFDACVSFYVFNHVPRERVHRMSQAGPWLVAAPDMRGRGSRRLRSHGRAPSARASASRKAQRSGAGRGERRQTQNRRAT